MPQIFGFVLVLTLSAIPPAAAQPLPVNPTQRERAFVGGGVFADGDTTLATKPFEGTT